LLRRRQVKPEQLEIDRLHREVTKLEAQGGARHPKKGRSLLREGSDMKFAFIAKHRSIWPVAWQCEALGVSRSGFHACLTQCRSTRALTRRRLVDEGGDDRATRHGCAHVAVWRRDKPDALLHHSYQGSQYTSEQFRTVMADHGIDCSMSQSGNVWDNAAMESFFSSVKTERIGRKVYRARDGARSDVFDYIERFYNTIEGTRVSGTSARLSSKGRSD
jgi:putative transposase